MSLSQIRNAIDALCRKYAIPLAIYRLRPLAEEFSQQWSVAEADRKPAPESHPFIRKIALAGFSLPTFMELHKYIERCRRNNTRPDVKGIIRCLLPRPQNSATSKRSGGTAPQRRRNAGRLGRSCNPSTPAQMERELKGPGITASNTSRKSGVRIYCLRKSETFAATLPRASSRGGRAIFIWREQQGCVYRSPFSRGGASAGQLWRSLRSG